MGSFIFISFFRYGSSFMQFTMMRWDPWQEQAQWHGNACYLNHLQSSTVPRNSAQRQCLILTGALDHLHSVGRRIHPLLHYRPRAACVLRAEIRGTQAHQPACHYRNRLPGSDSHRPTAAQDTQAWAQRLSWDRLASDLERFGETGIWRDSDNAQERRSLK